MDKDEDISFSDAHPMLSDPILHFMIGLILAVIILLIILYPIQNAQIELVKKMDCKAIHDKFLNNDLYMLSTTYLEQQYTVRCLT